MVNVHEEYRNFTPPFDIGNAIRKMLETVPPRHLVGLEAVVVTNLSSLNLKKRRFKHRKRKIDPSDCSGLYHQSTTSRKAWIELFADNLISGIPIPWFSRFRFIQELAIARTLFHEIGHHIDLTTARDHEPEVAADRWGDQLRKAYMKKYYSHLEPLILSVRSVVRGIAWLLRAK